MHSSLCKFPDQVFVYPLKSSTLCLYESVVVGHSMGSEDSPIDQEEKTEEPEQIQAFYNWGDTAPSAAVIDTVAFAAHRELSDLPLLYEVVEPEALDKLITSSNAMRASQDSQLSISFAYANCAVTIKCDGEVCIRSPTHSEKQSG